MLPDAYNVAEDGVIATAIDRMAGRKGLDWLIDYAVTSMEGQHRREVIRLHGMIRQMGEALLVSNAALIHHPNGDSRGTAELAASIQAVEAYNAYRED